MNHGEIKYNNVLLHSNDVLDVLCIRHDTELPRECSRSVCVRTAFNKSKKTKTITFSELS